jgi:hypothetical protein
MTESLQAYEGKKLKPCAATLDQRKQIKSQSLIAGVSLNRTLSPVAKDLQKGAVFKETNLPKNQKNLANGIKFLHGWPGNGAEKLLQISYLQVK